MSLIHLHGDLERFGGPFDLDVTTPADAIRGLCAQLRGFRRRLTEGQFRIVRVGKYGKRDLYLEALTSRLRGSHELHIVPVTAGSGGSTGKIILGVVMIAAAFVFAPAALEIGAAEVAGESGIAAGTIGGMGATAFAGISFGQIAGFGAALLLGGVAGLLSPTPKTSAATSGQDTNSSFIFNGPANVAQQGVARPLIYGRFIGGSVVISSALAAEQI